MALALVQLGLILFLFLCLFTATGVASSPLIVGALPF
jgi:hypothetical protein